MVLARCLYESSKETKAIVLELAKNSQFPIRMISEAMCTLQQSTTVSQLQQTQNITDLTFPVIPLSQMQRIDSLISKFDKFFTQELNASNMLTSDVFELYEYKLVSMGNAERAAMASAEAASERCAHLQHQNAQMGVELNRLRQLLCHMQQGHEQTLKAKDTLTEYVEKLKHQVEVDKGKLKMYKDQLSRKETQLDELTTKYAHLEGRLNETLELKKEIESRNAELKQLLSKLEENSKKVEGQLQSKKEALVEEKRINENLSLVGLPLNS